MWGAVGARRAALQARGTHRVCENRNGARIETPDGVAREGSEFVTVALTTEGTS